MDAHECGRLRHEASNKLFPFPARSGEWRQRSRNHQMTLKIRSVLQLCFAQHGRMCLTFSFEIGAIGYEKSNRNNSFKTLPRCRSFQACFHRLARTGSLLYGGFSSSHWYEKWTGIEMKHADDGLSSVHSCSMDHRLVSPRQDIDRLKVQFTRQMGVVHNGVANIHHAALLHVHDTEARRHRKSALGKLDDGWDVYHPLSLPCSPLATRPKPKYVANPPTCLPRSRCLQRYQCTVSRWLAWRLWTNDRL